jgi:exodeoxyribonuclease-5
MPSKVEFQTHVENFFPHQLTEMQARCMNQLIEFTFKKLAKDVFILTGYAGTGKTSLISAYVNALKKVTNKFALLAPTGRAAKVFSNKSEHPAFTIHSFIYKGSDELEPGAAFVKTNENGIRVLLIDEASMIAESSFQEGRQTYVQNLLQDLFTFAYSNGDCKIIFVGDEGQLPPVGCSFSPALNADYLKRNYYDQNIYSFQLTEVLRQAQDSDILLNATMLRGSDNGVYPKFELRNNADLKRVDGYDLPDELDTAISKYGIEDTIVITRSNKRANEYNQQIRGRILWFEEVLVGGDYLMVVKNNYKWLPKDANIGFIANGEIIKIKRVYKVEEMYGFQFAQVSAELVDYPNLEPLEVYLNLDPLTAETPNIERNRMKELWDALEIDYGWEKNKKKRYKRILEDPYFCALQVKYAYAVTCHKSQGGQWSAVFLDQGYLVDEHLNQDFFRWLYTGFTRATEELKLVAFHDEFFD